MLQVRVLGPLKVVVNAEVVPIGGPKPATLMAVLTVSANQTVSDARLIDAIWPHRPPQSAAKTLHSMASRLRSAVGDELRLERSEGGYLLDVGPQGTDVRVAEDLLRRAQATRKERPAEASSLLAEASALWRGRPYGRLVDAAFTLREVARIDALQLSVVEDRIDIELSLGHFGVVAELESLVREHPLHETFWAQLMTGLYHSGRQADSLNAYQRVRGVLARELGIDPGSELQRLEQAILGQELVVPGAVTVTAAGPELPTGVGALLFAEIDQWQRKFAEAGDGLHGWISQLWDEFDRVMEAHGGHTFDRRAHRHRVAFSDVPGSVRAAWAARTADLRIGLHEDELVIVAGDYLGAPTARANDLVARAPAGHVVASSSLGQFEAPAGARWLELADGNVVLSGSDTLDQRLLQPAEELVSAGDLTTFVGRTRQLREIAEQWEASRLVTISGIGGIGKTRIAMRLAASERLARRTAGIVVELASLRRGSAVLRTIAAAAGVSEPQEDELLETLAAHLRRQRRVDLVLDNCEHVVEASSVAAESLLRRCPELRILATSREPLRIPGEVLYRLPPLDVERNPFEHLRQEVQPPEALQLFLDRAAASDPGWDPSDEDRSDIASICRRLDGIPLAIELAAARVRHFGVRELATRIDGKMALLMSGEPSRPERHRTLRAAIDWSYELLSKSEAGLFADLAVFAGGWTLAAAEAVASPRTDDVGETLAALVDKSLVLAERREGRMRYRMLETVRTYAAERLETDRTSPVLRTAHLGWYHAFAGRVFEAHEGPDDERWMRLVDLEYPNIIGALEWGLSSGAVDVAASVASKMAPYWAMRGLPKEGGMWLDRIVSSGQFIDRRALAEALLAKGGMDAHNDSASARDAFTEAVALARDVGDFDLAGRALLELGLAQRIRGDSASAAASYSEAARIFGEEGNRDGMAGAMGRLGDLAFFDCRGEDARHYLEEAVRLNRELDKPLRAAWSIGTLALVESAMGEHRRAHILVAEAAGLFEVAGSSGGRAWIACAAGEVTLGAGDADAAIVRFTSAIELLRSLGKAHDTTWALFGRAAARLAAGNLSHARRDLHACLAMGLDAGQEAEAIPVLRMFGLIQVAEGDFLAAARSLLLSRSLRHARGGSVWPQEQQRTDAALEEVRRELGEAAFESAVTRSDELARDGIPAALRSIPDPEDNPAFDS